MVEVDQTSGGNTILQTPCLYTGGLHDRTTGWIKNGAGQGVVGIAGALGATALVASDSVGLDALGGALLAGSNVGMLAGIAGMAFDARAGSLILDRTLDQYT